MQTLFTIHAEEYLVGSRIEQNLACPNSKKVSVWVPSKDTVTDLLVTDKSNTKTTSLQVRFSKDFLATNRNKQKHLKACGWLKLNLVKIKNSPANYWVLVLHSFTHEPV